MKVMNNRIMTIVTAVIEFILCTTIVDGFNVCVWQPKSVYSS